ncbi:MAG: hypothetical protein HS111_19665 [Kofleriaceae bacterium]|nr:hypothetical protein [Kofleriaceae bacterium]
MVLTAALALALTGCKKKEEAGAGAASGAGHRLGALPPPRIGRGLRGRRGRQARPPAPAPPIRARRRRPPPATSLLPQHTPKVGDKLTKLDEMTMKLTIEAAPGKTMEMDMVKTTEESREVLALDGTIITKARYAFPVHKETQTMGGKSRDKVSPLVGKSYIVWREGGKLQATTEDGATPPPDELAEILDEAKNVGTPDVMDEVIASKTWKPGARVVFTADDLAKINARNPDKTDKQSLQAMAFTLTGVDGGVATFDMEMTMLAGDDKGTMTMTLTGAARVDVATGRLLEVGGAGTVDGQMGMPLKGTMSMKTINR